MTHVTCRLTAKNRDQLRNSTLGNRVWAAFAFYVKRNQTRKAFCKKFCMYAKRSWTAEPTDYKPEVGERHVGGELFALFDRLREWNVSRLR